MNINPKDIGIGILDLYTQEDLNNCLLSIPESLKENMFVVSNNKNLGCLNIKRYTSPVQLATMRNYLISQMRLHDCKYYFLLHSNTIVKDADVFEKTIKIAETFGTWAIMGESTDNIPLEDDVNNITLNLSKHMNTEFMFLFSGIIKNNGYFDERFFNGKDVDVLDYILKLRNKGVYPPTNYHPTITDGIEYGIGNINKMGFKDIPDVDRTVQLAYGHFFNNNKYIPTENDPPHVSQEELLTSMEKLQQNYAKK